MSYTDTHTHSPVYISDLHDHQGNLVLPCTVAQAVYMPDKKRTIYDEIESWKEESYLVEFPTDGSIRKTFTSSGDTIVTTFNDDGSISETYRYAPSEGETTGKLYYTQTTTFNENGDIQVTRVYAQIE